MATILELGDDRFIAGDPPEALADGQHWCDWCGGSGLDYAGEDGIEVCGGCWGTCVRDCTDTACTTHSSLHPAAAYPGGVNLRVPVSAEDLASIRRARATRDAAEAEFRRVVVEVSTRSSDRETAKAAEVSTNTLTRWKRDQ